MSLDITEMMSEKQKNSFVDLGISKDIVASLSKLGFLNPTEVQSAVIPIAASGSDVLAQSRTGSGKTLAFCIPVIDRILSEDDSNALILTPTREIANQVGDLIASLAQGISKKFKFITLIGGVPISRQVEKIKKSQPRIIIATPGRFLDHVKRSSFKVSKTNLVVLDEFDRMLDMGFSDDVEKIIGLCAEKKQMLLFSATMNKMVQKLTSKHLSDPEKILIGGGDSSQTNNKNIAQDFILCVDRKDKYSKLLDIIQKYDGDSMIIFSNTKRESEHISDSLNDEGIKCRFIHGDLVQRKRQKHLQDFRDRVFNIIVTTDVMARGVDVPHVKHVINYDVPRQVEDYVHRIGRTARGDANGNAISIITKTDRRFFKEIVKIMNLEIQDPFGQMPESSSGGGKNRKRSDRGDREFRQRGRFGSPRRSGSQSSELRDKGGFGNQRRSTSASSDSKEGSSFGNQRRSGGQFSESRQGSGFGNQRRSGGQSSGSKFTGFKASKPRKKSANPI